MDNPPPISFASLPTSVLELLIADLDPEDAINLYGYNTNLNTTIEKCLTRTPPLVIGYPWRRELFLKFISSFPNLTHIDLSHSYYLTDDLLHILVEKCPNIQVLKLWNCLSIRDEGVAALSKLTALRELNVGDNTHITAKALIPVVQSCKQLTSLDFSGCSRVDESLAESIAENCTELEFLNAEFCEQFCTDAAMQALSRGKNEKLRELLLMGGLISDTGITYLTNAPFAASLRIVDLRRNMKVQKLGYDTLYSELKLDSIDGISTEELAGNDVGNFFMLNRQLQSEA